MELIRQSGKRLRAHKTRRLPKMRMAFGRTWDCCPVILDGQEIAMYYDTTWGTYYHFQLNSQTYRIEIPAEELQYKENLSSLKEE